MSFFGSLLGDFEDDPFTGHMRQMNRMMNSFFHTSPFGSLMGGSTDLMPFDGGRRGGNAMMPFGFPDMDRMFQGMEQGRGNCHAFSSSTMMTMTNGPDGRPQVYQASQSVRSGPGGVRETKKTVADSRTGVKKMAIGHHIGERAHIMEREQNLHSGEQEEHEEFINLEEDDAGEFNREWERKTRNLNAVHNAIGYPSSSQYGSSRRHRDSTPMLPPAPSQSSYRSRPRLTAHRRQNYSNYPALPPPSSNGVVYSEEDDKDNNDDDEEEEDGVKIVELDDDEDEVENDDDDDEPEEVVVDNKQETTEKKEKEKLRKREHEPDIHYKSKVQKISRDPCVKK